MTARPMPDIRIPESLRPADGRFGSGPSKVRPEGVAALVEAAPSYLGTSHRRDGVRNVVRRVRRGIAELFGLPEGYEVVLGNGGATAFWDIATLSLIDHRSQHLAFGEFSARFADLVRSAPHLAEPDVISTDAGSHPDPRAVEGVDAYALTHNETSTGVCMEVRRVEGADDGALVLVDATSAAGGMWIDPTEFDAYYFSPQKCFGSEGGMWLALCSPAAIDRATRLTDERWVPPTLDLRVAIDNSRLDQTLNTPALATLLLLAEQVEWMLASGGLEWAASRCELSAAALYGWAAASSYAGPFVSDPAMRSPVVGTIDLDATISADTVASVLRANGIVDTESYRKLGRNQLRIALFPAIEPSDVEALTACIDWVVERL